MIKLILSLGSIVCLENSSNILGNNGFHINFWNILEGISLEMDMAAVPDSAPETGLNSSTPDYSFSPDLVKCCAQDKTGILFKRPVPPGFKLLVQKCRS